MDDRIKTGCTVKIKPARKQSHVDGWDIAAKKLCGKRVTVIAFTETKSCCEIEEDNGRYLWYDYQFNLKTIKYKGR